MKKEIKITIHIVENSNNSDNQEKISNLPTDNEKNYLLFFKDGTCNWIAIKFLNNTVYRPQNFKNLIAWADLTECKNIINN